MIQVCDTPEKESVVQGAPDFSSEAPLYAPITVHSFLYVTGEDEGPLERENSDFCFNIITSGTANLLVNSKRYFLVRGTAFFTFPGESYVIDELDGLEFVHISYTGTHADIMLNFYGIDKENTVVSGLEYICDHLKDTASRVNQTNFALLAESALLYAMSFVVDRHSKRVLAKKDDNIFEQVMAYIDVNYCDSSLSLGKIGSFFSYSEKYISTLIKKNLGEGFARYLNRIRVERAKNLMQLSESSINEISTACGYSDSLYFSKVFKKFTGKNPTEYIKELKSKS